jgi:hypothetical protein
MIISTPEDENFSGAVLEQERQGYYNVDMPDLWNSDIRNISDILEDIAETNVEKLVFMEGSQSDVKSQILCYIAEKLGIETEVYRRKGGKNG